MAKVFGICETNKCKREVLPAMYGVASATRQTINSTGTTEFKISSFNGSMPEDVMSLGSDGYLHLHKACDIEIEVGLNCKAVSNTPNHVNFHMDIGTTDGNMERFRTYNLIREVISLDNLNDQDRMLHGKAMIINTTFDGRISDWIKPKVTTSNGGIGSTNFVLYIKVLRVYD